MPIGAHRNSEPISKTSGDSQGGREEGLKAKYTTVPAAKADNAVTMASAATEENLGVSAERDL